MNDSARIRDLQFLPPLSDEIAWNAIDEIGDLLSIDRACCDLLHRHRATAQPPRAAHPYRSAPPRARPVNAPAEPTPPVPWPGVAWRVRRASRRALGRFRAMSPLELGVAVDLAVWRLAVVLCVTGFIADAWGYP